MWAAATRAIVGIDVYPLPTQQGFRSDRYEQRQRIRANKYMEAKKRVTSVLLKSSANAGNVKIFPYWGY